MSSLQFAANLRSLLAQATPSDWEEGSAWYREANALVHSLAAKHNLDPRIVAAVFAVTSPKQKWDAQVKHVPLLLAAAVNGEWYGFGLRMNMEKAHHLVRCGVGSENAVVNALKVYLRGVKVTAFYNNLMSDLSCATVDIHAANAAMGTRYAYEEVGFAVNPSSRVRLHIIDAYLTVAREQRLPVAVLQAVVWVTYRRINGIV